jgi:hypothetical protein
LLSAERDEEALIELAESQGVDGTLCQRRSDANPHAVLGIGWRAEVEAPVASESVTAVAAE